ncbi:uncharacterized protein LOC144861011 [Branchiostoma floridae x Branchiostoma japonicum]
MKVLNSAVVKAKIKVVIEDLEEVLQELKKVAAELRVIIEQIDDITARIDQEEARVKSLQLLKGREDSMMSLLDPRGRPNGQPKIQTTHCNHISDITGGARSRTRCEYPDILVSSPPQFQHLRETAIVDTQLFYSLGAEGGHRQYNTIDTSELRKMQSASCVETKSQTLRTPGDCRYSPVGAESDTGDGQSRKSCTLDRRSDSATTRLVTMRNGPIRTVSAVNTSSTSVSKLIESEEALETCRQDTHSYVLHGTRLMHTCSGRDCGGHRDTSGDSDSVLTIESTGRLVKGRTRNEEYICGDSTSSSSISVHDETVSMMRKSTSGCFSCAAASNTDSNEELAVTRCLSTRRTWRSQTVSDARRRFFRPKVELRNGTGIRYHTMDDHVMKADTHFRESGGAHSVLTDSQTWLVSTGSQTTEDISDVEADERVKNYLRDFVNLRDEITKL